MLLMLLISGLWTAGVLLVAGLCAAARRGDREQALLVASEPLAPLIAVGTSELTPQAVRAAA